MKAVEIGCPGEGPEAAITENQGQSYDPVATTAFPVVARLDYQVSVQAPSTFDDFAYASLIDSAVMANEETTGAAKPPAKIFCIASRPFGSTFLSTFDIDIFSFKGLMIRLHSILIRC